MPHTRTHLITILLASLMVFAGAVAVAQQSGGNSAGDSLGASPADASPESLVDLELPRRALVMGNSDYEAGPLENPENDARAMAGVLEKAGFEVMLRTDRSLEEMDKDLRAFREAIEEGETALFFYAGHGVQADGENYLLPVNNEGIGSSRELRRRAILANDYIEAMNEAGAGINIVMLDACRDNPLPAETRGGARGLSVMSAPRESETVIVFATKAGSVAEDGEGDNSTFTEAFLETVQEPDLGVMELFNKVGAQVREKTGGEQVPTIYSEPLSKSFSFFSSKRMAERAKKASREAQAELEELEEEIAARQRKIEQAEDEAERRRLEVEQQERKAKLAAQRLEAQNLEREAKPRVEEAWQTECIRTQLREAIETLDRQTWTIKGSDVSLEVGEYARNERTLPFYVSSKLKWLPIKRYQLDKDFSKLENLREPLVDLSNAVQAKGLIYEMRRDLDGVCRRTYWSSSSRREYLHLGYRWNHHSDFPSRVRAIRYF